MVTGLAFSKCCEVRMDFDESFFCRACGDDNGWYYICPNCLEELAECACNRVEITRPPVEQRTSGVR
jgi:predicted amidophosphoribosyltransferase